MQNTILKRIVPHVLDIDTKSYFNQFERDVFERLVDVHTSENYVVGGFVRDILLGNVKKVEKKKRIEQIWSNDEDMRNDVDITTTLTPPEVERVFKGTEYTYDPYGEKYGTVRICSENEKECVDITTMKADMYIGKDGVPEVKYGRDILRDLELRDFTINTLLIDNSYSIIDYFHVKEHVFSKKLCYVPSPAIPKYIIDAFLLFRAARFISHGFIPDSSVIDSFYDRRIRELNRLQYVSRKRVYKELRKMSDITLGLYYLHDSGILYEYFTDLQKYRNFIAKAIETGKNRNFVESILESDLEEDDKLLILRTLQIRVPPEYYSPKHERKRKYEFVFLPVKT